LRGVSWFMAGMVFMGWLGGVCWICVVLWPVWLAPTVEAHERIRRLGAASAEHCARSGTELAGAVGMVVLAVTEPADGDLRRRDVTAIHLVCFNGAVFLVSFGPSRAVGCGQLPLCRSVSLRRLRPGPSNPWAGSDPLWTPVFGTTSDGNCGWHRRPSGSFQHAMELQIP
jgi:hypothetical protein